MENSAITDYGIFYHCRKLHQVVCHGLLYILPFYWFILSTLPLCQLRVQNYYIMAINHTKAFLFD